MSLTPPSSPPSVAVFFVTELAEAEVQPTTKRDLMLLVIKDGDRAHRFALKEEEVAHIRDAIIRREEERQLERGGAMGKSLNHNGYVRFNSGPHRWKMEHRVIADQLWRETYGVPLPDDKDVHHQDFHRAHNCPHNLLILDQALHQGGHSINRRWRSHTGRFKERVPNPRDKRPRKGKKEV